MKQQVLLINGGTTYPSYEEYLSNLKSKEVKLQRIKAARDWKDTLQEELGDKFDVFVPNMPNKTNAQYGEWKIWFEKIIEKLDDNLILIGHSLGGSFLTKYLSENNLLRKIKALILVSTPHDDTDLPEPLAEFNIKLTLEKLSKQCPVIYLINSKDDPIIPESELEKYKKELPNAKVILFEDRGHFWQEEFPEMANLIKRIS